MLLLEFQSGVDRAMAVRMLAYSGLLYQRLVAEGVLRERGALPPVLLVVIYNGRSPCTAPVDVAELIAATGAALVRYQPSQRFSCWTRVGWMAARCHRATWCRR